MDVDPATGRMLLALFGTMLSLIVWVVKRLLNQLTCERAEVMKRMELNLERIISLHAESLKLHRRVLRKLVGKSKVKDAGVKAAS